MKDLFIQFLDCPNRSSYESIRTAVIADKQYDPYADDLASANALLEAAQLEEAKRVISSAMPNLLLSPLAHQMLAFVADQQGDSQTSEVETRIAVTCCEGILSTGDGTMQSPYQVSRTSDEHDLVRFLAKRLAGQSIHQNESTFLDEIRCTDGTILWFDISVQYQKLKPASGNDALTG